MAVNRYSYFISTSASIDDERRKDREKCGLLKNEKWLVEYQTFVNGKSLFFISILKVDEGKGSYKWVAEEQAEKYHPIQ